MLRRSTISPPTRRAQTQIDVNHTSTWTLTPSSAFDFGGGIFIMKDGSNTSATVTLSLYQGTDASGTLLALRPRGQYI